MTLHIAVRGAVFSLLIAGVGCSPSMPQVDPVTNPQPLIRQAFGVKGTALREDGTSITNVDAAQQTLSGIDASSGQVLRGVDFVGVHIPIRYTDGSDSTAEVTDWQVVLDTSLEFFVLRDAEGAYLCGKDESGAPIRTVMVPSVFDSNTCHEISDPSRYTLACYGAMAQCGRL